MEEKTTKRVSVVMDADLHKQLKVAAALEEKTIAELVCDAVKDKLEDMNKAAEKK